MASVSGGEINCGEATGAETAAGELALSTTQVEEKEFKIDAPPPDYRSAMMASVSGGEVNCGEATGAETTAGEPALSKTHAEEKESKIDAFLRGRVPDLSERDKDDDDSASEKAQKIQPMSGKKRRWESFFEKLEALSRSNDGNVNFRRQRMGHSLHEWTTKQRKAFQKGELGDDRTRRLKSIGLDFGFDPRKDTVRQAHEDRFEAMYQDLLAYREEHGNCYVPFTFKSKNGNLGEWVSSIKSSASGRQGLLLTDVRMTKVSWYFLHRCF